MNVNAKTGQTSQLMTRISNRIDDLVRELHSIKEVVCEELIPLQIAEEAQQLGRVPKVDELYEKIRETRIITREKFRDLARPILNQLSERADLQARHDSSCPKGPDPRQPEPNAKYGSLVKPAVNGSATPALPTIEPASSFQKEAPGMVVARLAGLLS